MFKPKLTVTRFNASKKESNLHLSLFLPSYACGCVTQSQSRFVSKDKWNRMYTYDLASLAVGLELETHRSDDKRINHSLTLVVYVCSEYIFCRILHNAPVQLVLPIVFFL